MVQSGDTVRDESDNRKPLLKIKIEHMYWMKRHFDFEYYDPAFIRSKSIKRFLIIKPEKYGRIAV